ncbi:hypothetical protein SAMN05428949_4752 [Chitinophaga sp. YR627]|jgi:hypothetical protein|nr:hypothetical protein SAMN05428949_4752 [Chitinophaga sp. YR627]
MTNILTYQSAFNASAAIRAVIASTCIVFIKNGEANPCPDVRG